MKQEEYPDRPLNGAEIDGCIAAFQLALAALLRDSPEARSHLLKVLNHGALDHLADPVTRAAATQATRSLLQLAKVESHGDGVGRVANPLP